MWLLSGTMYTLSNVIWNISVWKYIHFVFLKLCFPLFFKFLLECNWYTRLCSFQVYNKVNQLCIYIYIPTHFMFSSHIGHYGILSRAPFANVRSRFFLPTLYMVVCKCQSQFLSPLLPLSNLKFVFCICNILLCTWVYLYPFFSLHI